MASILNAPYFQDETAAYAKLESIVWPNGAVCPHCGNLDKMKRMGGNGDPPRPLQVLRLPQAGAA